jgi:hypothetical protein
MTSEERVIPSWTIYLKIVVALLPSTIVRHLKPPHEDVLYSLCLVLGVFLQALIPPRKKGFFPLLAFGSILALVYYVTSR